MYLSGGLPWSGLNFALAVVVVVVPLVTRWPLTGRRCLVAALVWVLAGGFPGAYVFSAAILLGAPVLALGILLIVYLTLKTDRDPPPPAS